MLNYDRFQQTFVIVEMVHSSSILMNNSERTLLELFLKLSFGEGVYSVDTELGYNETLSTKSIAQGVAALVYDGIQRYYDLFLKQRYKPLSHMQPLFQTMLKQIQYS